MTMLVNPRPVDIDQHKADRSSEQDRRLRVVEGRSTRPTAGERDALLGVAYPTIGVAGAPAVVTNTNHPVPAAGNPYVTFDMITNMNTSTSTGSTLDFAAPFPGGIWLIECIYGFSYANSVVGACQVAFTVNTGVGAVNYGQIMSSFTGWTSFAATTFTIINNGSAGVALRWGCSLAWPGQVTMFGTRLKSGRYT